MTRRQQKTTLTTTLRDSIAKSELSFAEMERRTGVLRQSLMKFAKGETSLYLDAADKLAELFDLELTPRKSK